MHLTIITNHRSEFGRDRSTSDALQNTPGVWGARMMGGGFGGMILVLVEHEGILPEAAVVQASEAGFVQEFL